MNTGAENLTPVTTNQTPAKSDKAPLKALLMSKISKIKQTSKSNVPEKLNSERGGSARFETLGN